MKVVIESGGGDRWDARWLRPPIEAPLYYGDGTAEMVTYRWGCPRCGLAVPEVIGATCECGSVVEIERRGFPEITTRAEKKRGKR